MQMSKYKSPVSIVKVIRSSITDQLLSVIRFKVWHVDWICVKLVIDMRDVSQCLVSFRVPLFQYVEHLEYQQEVLQTLNHCMTMMQASHVITTLIYMETQGLTSMTTFGKDNTF